MFLLSVENKDLQVKTCGFRLRMHETRTLFFAFCFIFSAFCSDGFAQEISSNELIVNAKFYDGKMVEYAGEPVGSLLRRGDFCWLNVHDGSNAIGIWMPRHLADAVKHVGRYGTRGDLIRVVGIFSRSCPEHGGGLDIHAQKVEVLKEGYALTESVDPNKIVVLSILLGVLVCLLIIRILLKKQKA